MCQCVVKVCVSVFYDSVCDSVCVRQYHYVCVCVYVSLCVRVSARVCVCPPLSLSRFFSGTHSSSSHTHFMTPTLPGSLLPLHPHLATNNTLISVITPHTSPPPSLSPLPPQSPSPSRLSNVPWPAGTVAGTHPPAHHIAGSSRRRPTSGVEQSIKRGERSISRTDGTSLRMPTC